MRDIFLIPFSTQLVFCVVCTGLLLALAMISITLVHYKINIDGVAHPDPENNEKINKNIKEKKKKWSISDAILWCISILFMQGINTL